MMRTLFLAFLLAGSIVHAQELYVPLDKANSITFSIRNFGVKIDGSFGGLTGAIRFDTEHPESGVFNVSVDATSIDTGIDLRDKHLRKEDFFDVEKYKSIKFSSVGIKKASAPDTWIVKGNLTIKGHTQEISIPFKVDKSTADDLNFYGEFVINRNDFDVGGRSISLGDDVTVELKVMARRRDVL